MGGQNNSKTAPKNNSVLGITNKMKKYIFYLLTLVSISFLTLSSCSKDENETTSPPATIYGKWQIESSTVGGQTTNLINDDWFYNFFGQNEMKENKSNLYERSKYYSLQNTLLTTVENRINLSGTTRLENQYIVKVLTNNKLVLELFYTEYNSTTNFLTDSQKETIVFVKI